MSIQQSIVTGIKEQLFFNDYLVLPGFGGFVLRSASAHFSASGGGLIPPSKTVSFNSQLKQNDGVLAIWLQKKLNCSAEEALSHLKEFSEYCSSILGTKRRLSLDGIGFFYLDFENNICFEPQADSNFLSSSFGLAPVSLFPIEPLLKEPKREPVFIDRTQVASDPKHEAIKRRVPLRRIANYAFASFVIVSLLFLLVANSKISGEMRSSLFVGRTTTAYVPNDYPELQIASAVTGNKAYVVDANGIAVMALSATKGLAVKAVETFSRSSEASLSGVNSYHVVLGCFSKLQNAKRMLKKLSSQNIVAHIWGKNAKGMFVVSYGDFSSKKDALSRLADIKDTFPTAWVKQPE
ncbi:MAG: SPOR domain-containing protein [bacterium]|nr:SPOR domain-containing protein [bacterium]